MVWMILRLLLLRYKVDKTFLINLFSAMIRSVHSSITIRKLLKNDILWLPGRYAQTLTISKLSVKPNNCLFAEKEKATDRIIMLTEKIRRNIVNETTNKTIPFVYAMFSIVRKNQCWWRQQISQTSRIQSTQHMNNILSKTD